jgi:cardiolipin synthase
VPAVLAIAILVRDALVAMIFPILERKGYPRIAVNKVGKAATMSIFLGMGFALLSAVVSPLEAASRAASVGFLILGATLYWWAGALYAAEIRRLFRARAAQRADLT